MKNYNDVIILLKNGQYRSVQDMDLYKYINKNTSFILIPDRDIKDKPTQSYIITKPNKRMKNIIKFEISFGSSILQYDSKLIENLEVDIRDLRTLITLPKYEKKVINTPDVDITSELYRTILNLDLILYRKDILSEVYEFNNNIPIYHINYLSLKVWYSDKDKIEFNKTFDMLYDDSSYIGELRDKFIELTDVGYNSYIYIDSNNKTWSNDSNKLKRHNMIGTVLLNYGVLFLEERTTLKELYALCEAVCYIEIAIFDNYHPDGAIYRDEYFEDSDDEYIPVYFDITMSEPTTTLSTLLILDKLVSMASLLTGIYLDNDLNKAPNDFSIVCSFYSGGTNDRISVDLNDEKYLYRLLHAFITEIEE